MKVYLSRWVCRDVESNLTRLGEEAEAARAGGADLVVFPESFLHGYTRSLSPGIARDHFKVISKENAKTLFAFGSISEERRNRMTIWKGGDEIARYDKVHLFGPNHEFDYWDPGHRYSAVSVGGLTIGLINCNDIRFPEQARAIHLKARCDLLIVVAWWPWRRDHIWETLLRARAIENNVWVIGCSVAASEYPGENFAGAGNHVFDPEGEPVRTPDDHFYDLDFEGSGEPVVDAIETHVDIGPVQIFEV
jgi:predicted amidohydrolase